METRAHFHAELDALKGRVIALAELVEAARLGATNAYLQHDAAVARAIRHIGVGVLAGALLSVFAITNLTRLIEGGKGGLGWPKQDSMWAD